ncbi:MAG: SRPBCC family protein [Gemmatimonadaceae bacterium]
MTTVEELLAVRAPAPHVMRVLTEVARMQEWVAPGITVTPLTAGRRLVPGERFRLLLPGGIGFDYLVEAVSDRELVHSFRGPWSGRDRWSIVPDASETIVRRVYQVDAGSVLIDLGWSTIGRALVTAHFKLELSRFRRIAERLRIDASAGPPAEIPPPSGGATTAPPLSFPVDDG